MAKISIDALRIAMDDANSIVLTVHVSPDGDAMGSMLAMYEALKMQGKEVRMVVDDEVPHKYDFLSHTREVLSIDDYAKNPSADLLLVLDASTFERIGKVGVHNRAPIFNIDHHISNTDFATGLYLREDCSSTCEIVAYLCHTWNWPITENMANALYMGMATDTGFFKFSNVTPLTLDMASLCVAQGAKPNVISEAIEIMSAARLKAMKEVLQTVEIYGSTVIMEFSQDLLESLDGDTDGFVDLIRNIEGIDVAVVLKAVSPTETRGSLRSKKTDVNAIAAQFGGGGHIRASGCTIKMPLSEAKTAVLKALGAI